jgi:ABC-type glycerol-3-phosphate transport system permease component
MTERRPIALAALNGLFLIGWVFLAAFPFAWMVMLSLRSPVDAFAQPPLLFAPVTFEHFRQVWVDDGFWRNAINSAVITIGVVMVSLTIGSLAGYALARYRGAFGFWLLILALIFRAMPQIVC